MKTYLDYAATTPVDARVLDEMLPYFRNKFGNPSSIHQFGQESEHALESSRRRMADLLQASPREIIFTSCGSESDNLAVRGAALAARKDRGANHLLISLLEHPAVRKTALQLEKENGFHVTWLKPDRYGRFTPEQIENQLRPETALVSIMQANNEIGTLNPISEIGEVCSSHPAVLHSDAVQGGAHFPLDVQDLKVDLLSLGAHKFYGPKGVGLLFVKDGTRLLPRQTGGSQENGYRAGTENVALIAGMATALQLVYDEHQQRIEHVTGLRDQLITWVLEHIPGAALTGHPHHRLPNHASFVFDNVDGNLLVTVLDHQGFAVSSASACKTGHPQPSDILISLGIEPRLARGALRVTCGQYTTREDLDRFLPVLSESVQRVRSSQ